MRILLHMTQQSKKDLMMQYLTKSGNNLSEVNESTVQDVSLMDEKSFEDWLDSEVLVSRNVLSTLLGDDYIDPKLRRQVAIDVLTMAGKIGQKDKAQGQTFVFSDEAAKHLSGAFDVLATAFKPTKGVQDAQYEVIQEEVKE